MFEDLLDDRLSEEITPRDSMLYLIDLKEELIRKGVPVRGYITRVIDDRIDYFKETYGICPCCGEELHCKAVKGDGLEYFGCRTYDTIYIAKCEYCGYCE